MESGNDSPVFYDYFRRSLEHFFQVIDDKKIKHVIHAGDLFDRRKYVNFLTAKACREDFLEQLEKRSIQTHIIAGNHDVFNKNTNEVNSLDELVGNRYKYIKTYIEPALISIDGLKIQLMPWINEKNQDECFDALKNTKAEILVGHLELEGFEMFKGVISHGQDRKIYSKFDMVFSGHYHHKSSSGNIHYLGAFAEYVWSDYDDPRGFHIFDTATRKLDHIVNPHKMFKVIEYSDKEDTDILSKIQNFDCEQFANSYVKIVCESRTNPYAFDMLFDKLYKSSPVDISVVEGSLVALNSATSNINVSMSMTDTASIVSDYISGLTLDVDITKMNSFMRGIYNEAVNVSNLE